MTPRHARIGEHHIHARIASDHDFLCDRDTIRRLPHHEHSRHHSAGDTFFDEWRLAGPKGNHHRANADSVAGFQREGIFDPRPIHRSTANTAEVCHGAYFTLAGEAAVPPRDLDMRERKIDFRRAARDDRTPGEHHRPWRKTAEDDEVGGHLGKV